MKSKKHLPILAGTLALIGLAGAAQAQTAVNIGGSSAGKNFATDVPLDLCDAGADITTFPKRFVSANGNMITWVCNRNSLPIIIRYSATGSSDGVNKLLQPASNPASNMNFLDHTLTAGCTGPTDVQRVADGKHYANTTGCADTNVISLPVIMGASDVKGSSFHQVGPLGTSVNPLDDSTLNSSVTAIVPFSVFVGKGVKAVNANGTIAGNISGLSRLQIEQIFARSVTDWQRLGLGTVADADPTTLEATSPIVLCLRNAGSGTKAAFDETVMINTTETPFAAAVTPAAGGVVFSSSTSGVVACLAANRRSIGYMDSDQDFTAFNNGGLNAGLAYPIAIDGATPPTFANEGNPSLSKRDLKCGKYPYWAGWRLNRRAAGEDAGGPIDALAQAFVTDAGLQGTIGIIPTGKYWASDEEMAVSKNTDKGPINWKVGNHPECR